MDHSTKARDLFLSGCSCSQAVFGAFADEFGIDQQTAFRLASSFGGGMGGMRETCGAVTGMLMAAGMKWGYSDIDACYDIAITFYDTQGREVHTYEKTIEHARPT